MSKTSFPNANNKRVLQPYSKSMEQLLKSGYKVKRRTSGHDISDKFNLAVQPGQRRLGCRRTC